MHDLSEPVDRRSTALISRRTALAAAGTAGAAALLAGCASSKGANTPLRTGGNHAEGGGAGDGGGDGDGDGDSGAPSGAPSAASGADVIELSAVPVGSATTAKLASGDEVFVAQPVKGSAKCFSRTCTHQGCTVNPPESGDPKQLKCPCHGSIYNALTGAVIQGPASAPLKTVAVQVKDGKVVTA